MDHTSTPQDRESLEALLARLTTTKERGLDSQEAEHRRKIHGQNVLPRAKRVSVVYIFFAQFATPLMALMLLAVALSVLLAEWFDAIVLGVTICANVLIGFFEEYQADRTFEALQDLLSPEVRVVRAGAEQKIPQSSLVPGDIVVLRSGDQVPADMRLLSAFGCEVNEAILTGESVPVEKNTEQMDVLYAGTTVSAGRARGVVVTTGAHTKLGQLAKRVTETEADPTPLQKELKRLARSIAFLAGLLIVVLSIVGLVRGYALLDIFRLSVAVAVSAIPEGMAISVTVMLAASMRRMLARKALIRKLIATETLGSVTVICADKTGTMTTGQMALEVIVLPRGRSEKAPFFPDPQDKRAVHALLEASILCNDIVEGGEGVLLGSATERGLYIGAQEFGVLVSDVRRQFVRIAERPFDPVEKCMITLHTNPAGGVRLVIKGAPEAILARSSMSREERRNLGVRAHEMTSQGLRVLAVATHEMHTLPKGDYLLVAKELVFLGFVGLRDPVRPGAHDQIERVRQAGIKTVMVTGDHPDTATQIAGRIGLPVTHQPAVTGAELDAMNHAALTRTVAQAVVFARVSPQHKIRLIEAYQEAGEVVAMTGDGVNDAPALKRADIGIALGSGTEVAKQAADMVLLDNNLATITAAIEEGRVVFDNIRKTITYLLAGSLSEVVIIGGALVIGAPLPLLATQILWVNLVVDGLPSLALAAEAKEHDVMQLPPRPAHEPVVLAPIKWMIVGMVLTGDMLLLLLFLYLWHTSHDVAWARTMLFAALGFGSLMTVFPLRSLRQSLFRVSLFSNRFLLGAVAVSALFMLGILEIPMLRELFSLVPLSLRDWGLLAMIVALKVFLTEGVKQAAFWRYAHRMRP